MLPCWHSDMACDCNADAAGSAIAVSMQLATCSLAGTVTWLASAMQRCSLCDRGQHRTCWTESGWQQDSGLLLQAVHLLWYGVATHDRSMPERSTAGPSGIAFPGLHPKGSDFKKVFSSPGPCAALMQLARTS